MKCKKCGKETNVVCICGICPKCNGMEDILKEEFEEFKKGYKLIK